MNIHTPCASLAFAAVAFSQHTNAEPRTTSPHRNIATINMVSPEDEPRYQLRHKNPNHSMVQDTTPKKTTKAKGHRGGGSPSRAHSSSPSPKKPHGGGSAGKPGLSKGKGKGIRSPAKATRSPAKQPRTKLCGSRARRARLKGGGKNKKQIDSPKKAKAQAQKATSEDEGSDRRVPNRFGRNGKNDWLFGASQEFWSHFSAGSLVRRDNNGAGPSGSSFFFQPFCARLSDSKQTQIETVLYLDKDTVLCCVACRRIWKNSSFV
jgi:hypothetical protein